MKRLILLFVVVMVTIRVSAQASLGMGGGIIYGIEDTVCDNSVDSYNVFIKNTGTTGFTGIVYVNSRVDSTGTYSWLYPQPDSANVSLQSGDSVAFLITHVYNTFDPYRVGGNIVVIWPSGNGIATTDSTVLTSVRVLDCSVVNEHDKALGIRLCPNPTWDVVTIRTGGTGISVKLIRIYDSIGRLIQSANDTETVSFVRYDNGVYFLHAEFDDGTVRVFKVVKK